MACGNATSLASCTCHKLHAQNVMAAAIVHMSSAGPSQSKRTHIHAQPWHQTAYSQPHYCYCTPATCLLIMTGHRATPGGRNSHAALSESATLLVNRAAPTTANHAARPVNRPNPLSVGAGAHECTQLTAPVGTKHRLPAAPLPVRGGLQGRSEGAARSTAALPVWHTVHTALCSAAGVQATAASATANPNPCLQTQHLKCIDVL
jgi:hypothetical protein